jgi:hypothetical protein
MDRQVREGSLAEAMDPEDTSHGAGRRGRRVVPWPRCPQATPEPGWRPPQAAGAVGPIAYLAP